MLRVGKRNWKARGVKSITVSYCYCVTSWTPSQNAWVISTSCCASWALRSVPGTGAKMTLRDSHSAYTAAFSPDGQRIAATSKWTVRVWNANTGEPMTKPTRAYSRGRIAWSPDGRLLGVGTKAEIWDTDTLDMRWRLR